MPNTDSYSIVGTQKNNRQHLAKHVSTQVHPLTVLVLHTLVGMSSVATAAAVAFQICLPPKLQIHGAVHYQQQQQNQEKKERKKKEREKGKKDKYCPSVSGTHIQQCPEGVRNNVPVWPWTCSQIAPCHLCTASGTQQGGHSHRPWNGTLCTKTMPKTAMYQSFGCISTY